MERVPPIPDELWQPIREYVAEGLTDLEWEEAIQKYPAGRDWDRPYAPFDSYFVGLGDRVVGQVEIICIKNVGEVVSELDYPPIGTDIRAVALSHTPGKQIRLSTRPFDLAPRDRSR